jgi:cell division protein FtsW (lipid II flippase)
VKADKNSLICLSSIRILSSPSWPRSWVFWFDACVDAFCHLGLERISGGIEGPDIYGCTLAAGLTTMVILQAALNIAVVSALLPTTGITLPLISSGGSSLVATLAGIGVVLNVSAAGEKTAISRA